MRQHAPKISLSWIIYFHCTLVLICFSEIPSVRRFLSPFGRSQRTLVSAFIVHPPLRPKTCFSARRDSSPWRCRSTETVIWLQEKDADTPSVSSVAKDANTASASSVKAEEQKRIEELEKEAKQMKVGELRSQLEANGVSTKIFLEKSEFVKAYVKMKMNPEASSKGPKSSSASSSSSSSSSRGTESRRTTETKDPSYRDVVVYKMNRGDPRLLQGGTVIDVRIAS